MQLFNNTHSYATYGNAINALEKACENGGTTLDEIRWFIIVNDQSRFIPAIKILTDDEHMSIVFWASNRILVIG